LKRCFCVIFSFIVWLSLFSCGKASDIETSYFDRTSALTTAESIAGASVTSELSSQVTESREASKSGSTESSSAASESFSSETSEKTESEESTDTVKTQTATETASESVKEAETEESAEAMVWVSATGKKYHVKKTCSNMKNPSHISIADAKESGYEPCKKCYG